MKDSLTDMTPPAHEEDPPEAPRSETELESHDSLPFDEHMQVEEPEGVQPTKESSTKPAREAIPTPKEKASPKPTEEAITKPKGETSPKPTKKASRKPSSKTTPEVQLPAKKSQRRCEHCKWLPGACSKDKPSCTRCIEKNLTCTYEVLDIFPQNEIVDWTEMKDVPLERRRPCVRCWRQKQHCTREVPTCQQCKEKGYACVFRAAWPEGSKKSGQIVRKRKRAIDKVSEAMIKTEEPNGGPDEVDGCENIQSSASKAERPSAKSSGSKPAPKATSVRSSKSKLGKPEKTRIDRRPASPTQNQASEVDAEAEADTEIESSECVTKTAA